MAKLINSYFPHDSNARSDRKILKLRRIHGWAGYGIYFALIEILREQPDFKYPLSQISELEYELRESKEIILSIITNFDLFIIDEQNNFFSISLVTRLQPFLEKSKRAIEANRIRWERAKLSLKQNNSIQKDVQMDLQKDSVSESKEKRREENKRKEKNIIVQNEFERFWKMYDYKIAREKCFNLWKKLSIKDKKEIFKTLPDYIKSKPTKQFRKHPLTYLRNKVWEDEIIPYADNNNNQSKPVPEVYKGY